MEHRRGYTYTEGDKEKILLMPCERIGKVCISGEFYSRLMDCFAYSVRKRDRDFFLTFFRPRPYVLVCSDLERILSFYNEHCPDASSVRIMKDDISTLLSYHDKDVLYVLHGGDAVAQFDVYKMSRTSRYLGRVDIDDVILIPYMGGKVLSINGTEYIAGRAMLEMGDSCRRKELRKLAKIFEKKFFQK